jgi:butyryl-CoA dehydrogenase
VLAVLSAAQERFGDKLAERQEIVAAISDIIIEVFALESAVLRAQKMTSRCGEAQAGHAIAMARVAVHSKIPRVHERARNAFAAIGVSAALKREPVPTEELMSRDAIDLIGLRREIASSLITHGKYFV